MRDTVDDLEPVVAADDRVVLRELGLLVADGTRCKDRRALLLRSHREQTRRVQKFGFWRQVCRTR